MINFYSQHGEDFLLNEMFKDKKIGFFVEVGCIDGRRFSNTLTFEERGWKGICVEAHSGYIDLLKKNRPNSIVVHCAAAEVDEEDVTFYANARGSLSTLDASRETLWREKYGKFFTGFEEQLVSKRRLDSIFDDYGVKEIDILSLDIEGYEVEALKGIDFNKYKPAVMVIESDTPAHRKQLEDILIPVGYHKIIELSNNIFYSTERKRASKVKNKYFKNIQLNHTSHPIDEEINKVMIVKINTHIFLKIAQKLKLLLTSISRKILNSPKKQKRHLSEFLEIGFHGDLYLKEIAFHCLSQAEQFIETGTNVGSTLHYVVKNFSSLKAYSCEPDKDAYEFALSKVKNFPNVNLFNQVSPDMLYELAKSDSSILEKDTVFWLDAHGYGYKWPLKDEIDFITHNFKKGYIFIDDFQVPGMNCFKWDEYENQICSFEFIQSSINKNLEFSLYYPSYTERTSKHHPLTGWCMIEFGHPNFQLPATLENKVNKAI